VRDELRGTTARKEREMSAGDFSATRTLRDGTPVSIRAVRGDDAPRFVKAFAGLDRETVYTRFFGYRSELPPAELARLGAIDFAREAILVATVPADGDEAIVGSARYVAYAASGGARAAEVAFTVEEDYQGKGIAGSLLACLVDIARRNDIRRFEADVLADNKAMRAVFARTGLPMRQRPDGGVVHIEIELATGDAS
jgi:RimJ/RimL family protein N-acetyltransferase